MGDSQDDFSLIIAAGAMSLLGLLILLTPRASRAEHGGERLAMQLRTNVVSIVAERESKTEQGYGFVVGEQAGQVYIATANHVVRGVTEQPGDRVKRVTIEYFHDQGVRYEAKLLETREKTYDLAVLRANMPAGLRWRREALGATESSRRTPVWFVGRSGVWYVPTQPGRINSITVDRIHIDMATILAGTSGAPLIAETGIIGMIAESEGSGVARAISIDIIRQAFEQWQLPWQLKPVMILVPAGPFEMGSTKEEVEAAYQLAKQYYPEPDKAWYEPEKPRHSVWVDAFYMDLHKVTMGDYEVFIREKPYSQLPDWIKTYAHSDQDPVIGVSWEDADAYCRWVGMQLPTEAQWEKAARGTDGRRFPWGLQPVDGKRTNYCDANCDSPWKDKSQNDGYPYLSPVGAYDLGKSFYGIVDLAGNVWEWVRDWYDSEYYSKSPQANPVNEREAQYRVVRGGSWDSDPSFLRVSYRSWRDPDNRADFIGFRCVLTVPH
jgi:formylglycine-generating enzyme required for sulfatase activity